MRKDSPLSLAGSPGNSETPTSNLRTVQLMLQRTFYYNTGIQNLVFCQGNFSFAIHPLVYRCPNHSVIVCIAKKASKGRSLGTQMECESDFFFLLSLGFLTFKNIFHLTPWWWCLPAMHSLSQIYSLGIPRGHLWLFTDHLFRAHDLQWPSYFLFAEFPAHFISTAVGRWRPFSANFLSCPTPGSRSAQCSPCPPFSYLRGRKQSFHNNLFPCVLDPTSSHLPGNLLSHFQAHIQGNF